MIRPALPRRPAPLVACVLSLLVFTLASARSARAEDCPDNVPAASKERRAIAKDWFSRAEAADASNDPIGALKAYQCSLKMVPHAFTAFNLGRLAERTGDLELAVDAFNTYLKLAPEAPDRVQIEAKVTSLGERIKTLRAEQSDPPVGPLATPPRPPTTEPPLDLKPNPAPDPAPVVEVPPAATPARAMQIAPWVIGGVGAAALVGGIVLNLSARGKMDDCRALVDAKNLEAAASACDAAKPRAYTSYALFGVAAAAAIADSVLLLAFSPESTERQMAAAPLADGAMLFGRFRF